MPGDEPHRIVSTTPDTAVVLKPAVLQTPAIITLVIFTARFVADLFRLGKRIVGIPQAIIPALREHLRLYVKPEAGALIFAGIKGGPMRRSGFNKLSGWMKAVRAIGRLGRGSQGPHGAHGARQRSGRDDLPARRPWSRQTDHEAIDKHLIGHELARDEDDDNPPGLLVPAG
ncbi:hypothetical protein ACFPOI_10060 [Nonomuraea angiospora]|uniref:Uncharacterized protein n=1 Tax=Nonomuraea angiospora TaxID=46172 RepID=A0ABR9M9W8_9ACTN|nr:hypothetical protein [Nonomuraea angiospora]MBE1589714.1 hypothetical protein [Nonomuraea angiospora]